MTSTGLGHNKVATILPVWAVADYNKSFLKMTNLTKTWVRLDRAIHELETHENENTIPPSLKVNTRVQVEKSNQAEVDIVLAEATKVFQTTLLMKIIQVRKRELKEKEDLVIKLKAEMLKRILEGLTDLHNEGITTNTEEEIREEYEQCVMELDEDFHLMSTKIRTEEFFAMKKKLESTQAAAAVREEARLNQDLLDPAIKAMQTRVQTLEKKLEKAKKPKEPPTSGKKAASKPKPAPKGKGPPPSKKGGGPKTGQGSGSHKPRHPSGPSTHPSDSRKNASRKKRN